MRRSRLSPEPPRELEKTTLPCSGRASTTRDTHHFRAELINREQGKVFFVFSRAAAAAPVAAAVVLAGRGVAVAREVRGRVREAAY